MAQYDMPDGRFSYKHIIFYYIIMIYLAMTRIGTHNGITTSMKHSGEVAVSA
jgi:hypothetical protein